MVSYKKEFFRDWFAQSGKRKEELKQVLGTSSGNSLQYWLLEKKPPELKDPSADMGDRDWLPLRCIIRLCNKYGLPLSAFFEDTDEPAATGKRKRRVEAPTGQDETTALKMELLQTKLQHEQEMRQEEKRHYEAEQAALQQAVDALRRENDTLRESLTAEKNEQRGLGLQHAQPRPHAAPPGAKP